MRRALVRSLLAITALAVVAPVGPDRDAIRSAAPDVSGVQADLPFGWIAGVGRAVRVVRRRGLAVHLCLLVVILGAFMALFAPGAGVTRSQAEAAAVRVHGRADARGFAALPVAARGPVSAAIGRDDRSFSARVVAGALTLRNRGQGLLAQFGERGVQIRAGRARLGLNLVGYGYGSTLSAVDAVAPWAQANRVVYPRAAGVREWYTNGPLGLEQGFTLSAPPARRAGGMLTLALAVSGNLHATLSDGAVTFSGAGQSLAYRGLVASDATGRRLPARIQLVRGRLLIGVDVAGARYPLRIDPLIQQAKLTASDGAADDHLGWAIAMSGDTIFAGAPGATVDGGSAQGAVYVFVEPTDGWANATQTAKLTDGTVGDAFGFMLAVSGDTLVVGAPYTTINGRLAQGAAYVFIEPTGGWANATTPTAELTASDGAAGDGLGVSVAISGDTIVAGAPGQTESEGAAYVFVEPTGGWANATQTAKLTASDGAPEDQLGNSIAMSGDTIVAGAEGVTVDGNAGQGAAYVFVEPTGGWVDAYQTAKLTASDGGAGDGLGLQGTVAISGDTVVAGAQDATVGANAAQGAVYVFVEPTGGWANGTQTAKLTASDGGAGDTLGSSVAISGDRIVAGAQDATVGANADQGAVYVFVEPTGGWANATQTAKLTASDGAAGDLFGWWVAASGGTIAAAAPGESDDQGATYVFGSGAAACAASPSITTQPSAQTVTAPAAATFTAAGSTPANCSAPSVQWSSEAPGASSFAPISGATSGSYTTPPTTTAQSGTK